MLTLVARGFVVNVAFWGEKEASRMGPASVWLTGSMLLCEWSLHLLIAEMESGLGLGSVNV